MENNKNFRNIDWDKLKLFYFVAKAGSFTIASQKLNLCQPTLSRSILMLEERLDIKLFNRHPRGIVLTKEGEILYRCAGKVLTEIENASSLLHEERSMLQGPLRVTATHSLINHYLTPLVPNFIKNYPNINLYFVGNDHLPNFDFQEADVALYGFQENRPDLIQELIMVNHIGLYASSQYLQQHGNPKTIEELDDHKLIAFGTHNPSFQAMNWHLSVGTEKGITRKPFMTFTSPQARLEMAAQGLGITAASVGHPALKKMDLIHILTDIPSPPIETYFIHLESLRNSHRIQVLKDYIKNEFSKRYQKV